MRGPERIVRAERQADIEAVQSLIAMAFRGFPYSDGSEPRIMDRLRTEHGVTLALVADEDETIVGQIAFSPITVDGDDLGWHCLGPLSVRPGKQRRGAGRALVEAGLARLRAVGAAGCVVVGDPRYYVRFGFRNDPALHASGFSQRNVMALSFGDGTPRGEIGFHSAFSAQS